MDNQTDTFTSKQNHRVTSGIFKLLALICITSIILSCGSDNGDGGGLILNQYTVGGTVSGLEGTGLVLQNNGTDDLSIDNNGSFEFETSLDDLSDYSVTVEHHPINPFQGCLVTNGSGTINGANITDVDVSCIGTATGGNCESGSIVYDHDIITDYQGFYQRIIVSGTVPFTCDDNNNITGSGTVGISVTGRLESTCTECNWSADATMNVTLSGALVASLVTIQFNETWYVGSPIATGSCTDTCDGGTDPYQYPLIEMPIQHTETFPDINGYRLEAAASGQGISGTYSWTLYIQ